MVIQRVHNELLLVSSLHMSLDLEVHLRHYIPLEIISDLFGDGAHQLAGKLLSQHVDTRLMFLDPTGQVDDLLLAGG